VKAARRQATLLGPPGDGLTRCRRQAGELTKSGRLELRVQTLLPFELPAACRDDTFAHYS
jgi:hypothetical protein